MKNKKDKYEYYKGVWYNKKGKIEDQTTYRVRDGRYQYWHSEKRQWERNQPFGSWHIWEKHLPIFNGKSRVLKKISKLEVLVICGKKGIGNTIRQL